MTAKFFDAREVKVSRNPMVSACGLGPEGRRCKTCRHLLAFSYARTYHKCGKGRITHSAATDHRVNWEACRLYEENN